MFDVLRQQPLILASASAPRKRLLQSLALEFRCIAAQVDEEELKQSHQGQDFKTLSMQLASAKALAISQQFPEAFVIGADQLCVFEQSLFGKPQNPERARRHLQQLQGQEHQQICGMSIAHRGIIVWQEVDVVHLWMRPLSLTLIEHYLQTEQPYHSCGAYHFEGLAKWLFTRVEGSDSSIQGLALIPLIEGLIQCGAVELI